MNVSSNVQLMKGQRREQGHICSNDAVIGGHLQTNLRAENACPPAEPGAGRQECWVWFEVTALSLLLLS